jgi:hypothetical protein
MIWKMYPSKKIYSGSNGLYECFVRMQLKPQIALYQVPSFFEVSAYTTLPQTVVGDTLDAWILGSTAENLDLLRIRLFPFVLYQRKSPASIIRLAAKKDTRLQLKNQVSRIQKIQDPKPKSYLRGRTKTH